MQRVRAPFREGSNIDTEAHSSLARPSRKSKAHPLIRNQVALIMATGSEPLPRRHHPLSGTSAQPRPPPAQGTVGDDVAVARRHEPEISMRLVRTMNVDDCHGPIHFPIFPHPAH